MSLLQLHEISKIFGGLIAINELSFSVEQGSVVGLIGPNGAGKTTVFNCIKEDDVAAEGCGINVTHYKLMAFVLGAFWAGMAGTLYAAKMTTIAPESFNFMESVIIFAVVILSGGSQLGVLVSAFLFIGLPELLREFSGARMLIFGLAMMLMMIWRPQGLMPPKSRRYGVAAQARALMASSSAATP